MAPLEWGSEADVRMLLEQYGEFFPPDCIIVSACVVWAALVEPLFQTIRVLARRDESNQVCHTCHAL